MKLKDERIGIKVNVCKNFIKISKFIKDIFIFFKK